MAIGSKARMLGWLAWAMFSWPLAHSQTAPTDWNGFAPLGGQTWIATATAKGYPAGYSIVLLSMPTPTRGTIAEVHLSCAQPNFFPCFDAREKNCFRGREMVLLVLVRRISSLAGRQQTMSSLPTTSQRSRHVPSNLNISCI